MIIAVNQILGILTVLGQVMIILLLGSWWFSRQSLSKLFNFLGKKFLILLLFIALVATLGSLFYSEIAGYQPCQLCWYQRILMYPQVLLLALALWRKELSILNYTALLSLFGAALAGYHYLMQLGVAPALGCAAIGYSISCSQRFVLQFGYITIPLMSFTAFTLIFLLSVLPKSLSKPKVS